MPTHTGRSTVQSRYETIARDLARAVAAGRLTEGERFSCRKIADRFRVSPETVRRAALLLEEGGVARLEVGSGVAVLSRERAIAYLKRADSRVEVDRIQDRLQSLLAQRRRLEEEIEQVTQQLLKHVFQEVDVKGSRKTEGGEVWFGSKT